MSRKKAVFAPGGLAPALAAAVGLDRAFSLCLSPPPGKLAAVFGDGACALALRALAAPLIVGGTVVVADGGNRFDPYAVSRAAAALGGDPRISLSRIRVSRAFTCHQFERLLCERLPAVALDRGEKCALVLVLGLHELFRDADVPFREACALFRRAVSALTRLSASGVPVLLAGSPTLARISHHASTAAADTGASTALPSGGLLDVVSTTPASPSHRAPCIHTRLHHLATNRGEKCGLGDRAGFFMHLARGAQPLLLVSREEGRTAGTLWLDRKRAPLTLRDAE